MRFLQFLMYERPEEREKAIILKQNEKDNYSPQDLTHPWVNIINEAIYYTDEHNQ
jgi:hypothetical protein